MDIHEDQIVTNKQKEICDLRHDIINHLNEHMSLVMGPT